MRDRQGNVTLTAHDSGPDQSMLLESGGQTFETRIYAPSSHVYKLGGHWNSSSGQVGLDSGHSRSVHFFSSQMIRKCGAQA